MQDDAAAARPWAEGALLGSLIAALIGGAAVARVGGGALGWLAWAGLVAVALGPAVGALRALRPLLSHLALPLGMLIALPVLALFGRVLKATTHHRPLGAATFAVVAAGVVLGCIALATRLVAAARAADGSTARRLARVAIVALGILCAVLSVLVMLPGLSADAERAGARAPLLELLVALALGAGAGPVTLPASVAKAARVVGPALWGALVVGGFAVTAL